MSSIPIKKCSLGLTGYMVLWVDLGVIWWLRVLAEVRVRDWRYCAMRTGDYAYREARVLHTECALLHIPHVTHSTRRDIMSVSVLISYTS